MKDFQLIQYLRQNLRFGCIKYSLINEFVDEERHLYLTISLHAYSKFYENDYLFIRNSVLESSEIREMVGFELYKLNYQKNCIEAIYKFDKC